MATEFPLISFELPPPNKAHVYALEPDVTCASIIRRFARDSGIHVSRIQWTIPFKYQGKSVYLEGKLVSDIIAKLLATCHRRSSRYQVRDVEDVNNVPVPVTEVIFGEAVGRSIIDDRAPQDSDRQRLEALAEMFIENNMQERRRAGRLSDHPGLEAELLRRYLTFDPREKRLALRIRVVKGYSGGRRPTFSIFEDNTSIGNFFISPDNVVLRAAGECLSDLARKLEQRLGSDLFVLNVRNQVGGDVQFYGMIENPAEVAGRATGEVLYMTLERVGTGRLTVRFDETTSAQLDVAYHWTLERLVEEIRECAPCLADVDFFLCVGGQILSSDDRSTPLGRLIDDSHTVHVTISTAAAPVPASPENCEGIREILDMSEFLRLQSNHFLRQNANRLAKMSLEDYVADLRDIVARPPSDDHESAPTTEPWGDTSAGPRDSAGRGKVTLQVPENALRLIKVFVYDAETQTEHVVENLSANARIYTVMERLERILNRDLTDCMLGVDDGFIVDQDRSLAELGILHGYRLLLENESDFESVVGDSED